MPPALAGAGIPSFAFPEAAARALGRVADYARWRRRPLGDIVEPDGIDRDAARRIVDRVLEGAVAPSAPSAAGRRRRPLVLDGGGERDPRAYGIPMARSGFVTTADEGAALQRDWGARRRQGRRCDPQGGRRRARARPAQRCGGRRGDRTHRDEPRAHDLGEHVGRYLVQEMVDGGVEMVVGVTHDPSFGPIIVTGMGGTLVELLRDVAVRITPVTDEDVHEMLDELRMAPLLRGYRGAPPPTWPRSPT
jgi:acetate---CoA ligase (ADP-forming)